MEILLKNFFETQFSDKIKCYWTKPVSWVLGPHFCRKPKFHQRLTGVRLHQSKLVQIAVKHPLQPTGRSHLALVIVLHGMKTGPLFTKEALIRTEKRPGYPQLRCIIGGLLQEVPEVGQGHRNWETPWNTNCSWPLGERKDPMHISIHVTEATSPPPPPVLVVSDERVAYNCSAGQFSGTLFSWKHQTDWRRPVNFQTPQSRRMCRSWCSENNGNFEFHQVHSLFN